MAAGKVVAVRAQELFDHSENVLDTIDIERVHDMAWRRAACAPCSRSSRPASPQNSYNDVLRDIKALADALGERRDPDVHIDALEGFAAAAAPSSRPGVRLLIGRFRDEQAEANKHLADALDEMERSDLQGRLRELVGSPRHEGAQGQELDCARRWPTTPSGSSHPPGRAVPRSLRRRWTPSGSSRCTTCASRPSACATCSR